MKVHYVTGIAALFVVAVHIMMRLILPFGMSLQYQNVIANYHNMPYAVLLEIILILVAVHGFNGLRIILIELRQGKRWEEGITILSIAATMAIIGYGTRTILIASGLSIEG